MEKNNQLQVVDGSSALPAVRINPKDILKDASEMAKSLQEVVNQAGLSRNFGGKKNHLEYEAWQTIGRFYNCTPVTEWTKPIKDGDKIIGWEARVNVVNADGQVIASAENMCMRDEKNWANRENYAIRSMAQTRTAGKALRSVFAFVAVMAGYSGTPAEEMTKEYNPATPKKEVDATAKQKNFILKLAQDEGKKIRADFDKKDAIDMCQWYAKKEKMTKNEASEMIERLQDDPSSIFKEFGVEPDEKKQTNTRPPYTARNSENFNDDTGF